jgi:hypothetical protein
MTVYGWYHIIERNKSDRYKIKRENLLEIQFAHSQQKKTRLRYKEKRQMKINLLPFLAAESDRSILKLENKMRSTEEELMKEVPGWQSLKPPVEWFWVNKKKENERTFSSPILKTSLHLDAPTHEQT